MPLKHLSCLLFFILFIRLTALAATFTVTSNADSGPGTLREAITMANANGSTLTDTIVFNIADVSEAGRTIIPMSELPNLSSKIIIDGSTQPGSVFGISSAKIIIYLDHFTSSSFSFLSLRNASDVQVYGLCFKYFDNPDAGGGLHYGILLQNSSNIIIGAPGKGNLFSAVRISITNNHWNPVNNAVDNITIQANVFGLGTTGQLLRRGSIYLMRASNITIGGITPAEGNVFVAASVYVSQDNVTTMPYFAKVQNNKFNLNWNGTTYFNESGNLELWGNISDNILPAKTFVKDNVFSSAGSGGMSLIQLYHQAIIQGNKLGTDITGTVCKGFQNNISTFLSKNVIIGGYTASEENIIAGDIYPPTHGTHVIKNKIHGQIANNGGAPNDPFIRILTYDAGLITGKANPNAKIQLYEDKCFSGCPAKTYHATTFSDAVGNWSFPYTTGMPNLVATSTMADSSTSAFTQPKVDHFTNRIIKHATCGRNNGSITGIKVFEGTHIRWYNGTTMQLVGTDTNLVNVPAGSYVLLVSNGENGCRWGGNFVIEDLQPPPTVSPSIINASCGLNNGSIITNSSSYGKMWMNANYDSIGSGYYINDLPPGTYYLKLWVDGDTSCNRTYGPFTIANLSGPSLNIDNAVITAATCENSNGSITGITSSNTTGTLFIQWVNAGNVPVGNSLDLLNMPAGNYKLKFKDRTSCDTIITAYFTIGAAGRITIDTSTKLISAAGCTVANGSIRNVIVTGADNLQWQNSTGNVVGAAADINNLVAGNYQLTATNATGCARSVTLTVPQAIFLPIRVTGTEARNAVCDEPNGFVRIISFNNDASLYSFHWVDSTSGLSIGTGTSLTNLGAGTYLMMARDTNGCEKQIYKAIIGMHAKPVLDYSAMKITDDNCSLQKGSITRININGASGPTSYRWVNGNDDTISFSPNLLNAGSGQYKLIVIEAGICLIESNWFTIGDNNISISKPLYAEQTIPRNTSISISPSNPEAATYYLYDNVNATNPVDQNATGQFTIGPVSSDTVVYVRKVLGDCISEITAVQIKVVDKSFFAIPSAFTPNNDGLNDRLTLKVIGVIDVEYFRIFNRNGELVFSTRTINQGWDGRINGILQPGSVFVWMARGKDINGKIIQGKGTFVLVR